MCLLAGWCCCCICCSSLSYQQKNKKKKTNLENNASKNIENESKSKYGNNNDGTQNVRKSVKLN